MMYTVSGRRVQYLEATGETLDDAIQAYREEYGKLPEEWEDDSDDMDACGEIVGPCEGCGAVILDSAEFSVDGDGIYTCHGCTPEAP